MPGIDRGSLLRRGVVLLGSGSALGALALPAHAAAIPDSDLAYLRLLLAVELLKIDYGVHAATSDKLRPATQEFVTRVVLDDKRHYVRLADAHDRRRSDAGDRRRHRLLVSARELRHAGSRSRSSAVAWRRWRLGAYLGALENVQTPELRRPLAQIAANEAQQAGAFGAAARTAASIGGAFAQSLQIDAVSAALDEYES